MDRSSRRAYAVFIDELKEFQSGREVSPGDIDHPPEEINQDDPLYVAVQSLEQCFSDDKLPMPAWTYWNKLLVLCNYPNDDWYDDDDSVSIEGRKAAIEAYELEGQLLRWAEKHVGEPSDGHGDEKKLPMQGYLGLRLEHARRVVTRVDHAGEIDLRDSQLSWGLMVNFSRHGDTICSKESLRSVWTEHGQAANPSGGTVYDAVNELKKRLHELGVTIRSVRRVGYQLQELSASGKPDRSLRGRKRTKGKRFRNTS